MRYKIVMEIDIDEDTSRATINKLANSIKALVGVSVFSNPVFLSTEQVMATEEKQILLSRRT